MVHFCDYKVLKMKLSLLQVLQQQLVIHSLKAIALQIKLQLRPKKLDPEEPSYMLICSLKPAISLT